jgi:class 3 adenylate cyclase
LRGTQALNSAPRAIHCFSRSARAHDAVNAAVDAQCALAGHAWQEAKPIRVRIGVHTCEATDSGDNYVGIGVHRAARVGSAGHGGQIVLSQATRELLQDDAGITCVDLGLHPLKDFEQPQRPLPTGRSAPAARFPAAAHGAREANQYRDAADSAVRT